MISARMDLPLDPDFRVQLDSNRGFKLIPRGS